MTNVAFTPQEEVQRKVRSRKLITWLLVFAIVMFFAGLTSAYVVSRSSAQYWVIMHLPKVFFVSTALILAGSVTMHLALLAARAGNTRRIPSLLVVTLLLGLGFGYCQWQGWGQLRALGNIFSFSNVLQPTGTYGVDYAIESRGTILVKEGDSFYMPDDVARAKPLNADMAERTNGASQYFYMLTWAHFAHVAFGLASLLIMIAMALRGRYTADDHAGLWGGAVYWHFLGGLWVYLLLFLLFVH
ncbi:MAG TPA: hypothetical protein VKG92_03165 [Flavobacteriales bacterium]|nr:hypothetical protein [Flavobacteriales bacterium]